MRRQVIFLLLTAIIFSMSCQLLSPVREGTVISNCSDLVSAINNIHSTDVPDYLLETGRKQGGELDVNDYFNALTNLSMQDGYALDYVYPIADLGASPVLYVHPADQAPYASMDNIPENMELPDFHDYVKIEDVERGYFEYVVMDLLAGQF
jgi:hypothetical protein